MINKLFETLSDPRNWELSHKEVRQGELMSLQFRNKELNNVGLFTTPDYNFKHFTGDIEYIAFTSEEQEQLLDILTSLYPIVKVTVDANILDGNRDSKINELFKKDEEDVLHETA